MKYLGFTLMNSLALWLISCRPSTVEPVKKERDNRQQEQIIAINRYLLERDMLLIESYARRNQLTLTRTQSGLSYQIVRKGKGKKIKPNDRVVFAYRLSLLDGTLCYSSDSLGIKEVQLGKDNIERGLDEGLTYLHPSDSAVFILPPHLAYGVMGDGKCIPPRTCIVYYVRIEAVFPSINP